MKHSMFISTTQAIHVIKDLGNKYRLQRRAHKYSLQKIEALTSVSHWKVSYFETGHGITLLNYIRILRPIDAVKPFIKAIFGASWEQDYNYICKMSDDELIRSIGQQVKMLRIKQQKTQEEISRCAILSMPTLSKLERGHINISLLSFIKLIQALKGKELTGF